MCSILLQVPREQALEYAQSVGALFAETSAKTAVNVQQLFIDISRFFSLPVSGFVLIAVCFPCQASLYHQMLSFLQPPLPLEELYYCMNQIRMRRRRRDVVSL